MGKGGGSCSRPAMRLPAVQAIAGLVPEPLLPRDAWRGTVFARDGGRCVVCGEEAVDAHHLIGRRLFSDGGYFESNGVSLCSEHHLAAEGCVILPSELRERAGIELTVVPPEFTVDDEYDTWGNPIGADGTRYTGPLFWDEACQRALSRAGTRSLYEHRMKYPRTYHIASSPGRAPDDLAFDEETAFAGREVVVTMKMDGENTTIGADYVHARSIDSKYHPSRTWVRALAAEIGHQLPTGWRVCGENLQAAHSIRYSGLPSYLLVFSIWDERNRCLSWTETEEWCELLGLRHVPEVYRGEWDRAAIQTAWEEAESPWSSDKEGYVIRLADGFDYREFGRSLAKFVRADHVTTEGHWMYAEMRPNGLEGAAKVTE